MVSSTIAASAPAPAAVAGAVVGGGGGGAAGSLPSSVGVFLQLFLFCLVGCLDQGRYSLSLLGF